MTDSPAGLSWGTPPSRTLRLGMVGRDVAAWKYILTASGYLGPSMGDVFWPLTHLSTKEMRRDYISSLGRPQPARVSGAVDADLWAYGCERARVHLALHSA